MSSNFQINDRVSVDQYGMTGIGTIIKIQIEMGFVLYTIQLDEPWPVMDHMVIVTTADYLTKI